MIFTTEEGIFNLVDAGTVYCILAKPAPCGCGRMAAFVVNRLGCTRCTECDYEFKAQVASGDLKELISDLEREKGRQASASADKVQQNASSEAPTGALMRSDAANEDLEASIRRQLGAPNEAELDQEALSEYHGAIQVPVPRALIGARYGAGWNRRRAA